MDDIFRELTAAENMPSELLKDVTVRDAEKPKTNEPDLSALADHTKQPVFATSEPQGGQQSSQTAQVATPTHATSLGHLMKGKQPEKLLDKVLVSILLLILAKVEGKTYRAEVFAATPDELSVIEPVLMDYLYTVKLETESPLQTLLLTIGIMYGSKYAAVKASQISGQGNKRAEVADFVIGESERKVVKERAETRGRHKADCQCPICKQRRNSKK